MQEAGSELWREALGEVAGSQWVKEALREIKKLFELNKNANESYQICGIQQNSAYLEGDLKGILASTLLFLGSLALVEASDHVVRTLNQPHGEIHIPHEGGTPAKSQH